MDLRTFLFFSYASIVLGQCWKNTYSRGIGVPVSSCANGTEKSGLLCYPNCKEGYTGVGPVCWMRCNSNLTDIGGVCWRSPHIIVKNCCCSGRNFKCCGNCPTGYTDDGCTCRDDAIVKFKKSYTRGFGEFMQCESDQEYELGLCYKKCRPGYTPVGPICYQTCFSPFAMNCGPFCGKDDQSCFHPILGLGAGFVRLLSSTFNIGTIGSLASISNAIVNCPEIQNETNLI